MNIFYAPPSQIYSSRIELKGQEAVHASKVLRYSKDDDITVVDGQGTYYKGKVQRSAGDFVQVDVIHTEKKRKRFNTKLAVGIIKKQNRLEFIVEKAVELGVGEITFFNGEHSVKQNVRLERLKSIALSAMKQSLQAWLPTIHRIDSLEAVIHHYPDCSLIAARQSANELLNAKPTAPDALLLVGPEGGLSEDEFSLLRCNDANFVRLSHNRLRTETAAISMLAQFSSSSF